MSESDIYHAFALLVAKHVHVHRIENAIASGIFDCTVSFNNTTLWFEFKDNVDKELKGSQVSWVMARANKGCELDMIVCSMERDYFVFALASDMAQRGEPMSKCQRVQVRAKEVPGFVLTLVYATMRGYRDDAGPDERAPRVH